MCGICAYIGDEKAFPIVLSGLEILQNRGYDSAGICTLSRNGFLLSKFASGQEPAISQLRQCNTEDSNTVGIAHTRWATHGPKTKINAHPQHCTHDVVSVVHNGIIENHSRIRKRLECSGYKLTSGTDTEVIPNLITCYIDQGYSMEEALQKATREMTGTWALAILNRKEPNKVYLAKHGSPLLVGVDTQSRFAIVASEQSALSNYTNSFFLLEDEEIGVLTRNLRGRIEYVVLGEKDRRCHEQCPTTDNFISVDPGSFPHWTLKEIHEQSQTVLSAYNEGGRLKSASKTMLGGLDVGRECLRNIKHLIVVACGTSYNAGLVGAHYMRALSSFRTVQIVDASEFNGALVPDAGKQFGMLCLSQSGETRDVISAINICRTRNIPIFAVVNVVSSYIARKSDCGVYLNSGREVGVAATKSFTSQCVVLSLVAMWFSELRRTSHGLRIKHIESLRCLHSHVEDILQNATLVSDVCDAIKECKSMFLLGTQHTEAIAYEGALKIKELARIHAEGYASAALKHGTFALIDEGTPIIFIKTGDDSGGLDIAAAQTICRGSVNILITDTNGHDEDNYHYVIRIPKSDYYSPVLAIIPIQLIAYHLAVIKGFDPDKPRNLAKTVTTR